MGGDHRLSRGVAILLAAAIGCGNSEHASMSSFEEDIRSIEARIVDLTWPGGLFRYDEFREIHAHPTGYEEVALQSLRDEDLSEQQKLIVALAMQKLPLAELLEFADEVIDLYVEGRISAKVLHWCILPTYDWNTRMVELYRREEVDRLLRRLAGLEELPEEFRRYVRDEVLTGKASETVRHLRGTGQIS